MTHRPRPSPGRRPPAERILIHLLPGLGASIGAVLGVLTSDHVTTPLVVLTALLIVCGFAVPPAVDRLRGRAATRDEQERLRARTSDAAAAERTEQLRGHFHPRGRGILPSIVREGSYFSGRVQVLRELVGWIRGEGPDVERARVVTGAPGSGKSAVLGRLVSLADPALREGPRATAPTGTLPPAGAFAVAVHVRGRTADEAAATICRALTVDETTAGGLLAHLREEPGPRPAVVVVDGVDEASDPYRLVVDLLEPLAAAAERTGIRLLVGTRRGGDDGLLRLFGASAIVLDLDAERYQDPRDVAEYVRRTLLAEPDPQVRTPYRARPAQAATVAAAVAARAGSSFLVAQLTALSLMASGEPLDPADPGRTEAFPATVGAAMDRYLRDVPGGPWLRDLLMALAWARGDGFDDPRTWAAAATALGTAAYSEHDVTRLLLDTNAVDLLHRTDHGDRVSFRLFHEALGEHLRQIGARRRSPVEIQRDLTDVLLGQLPTSSGGGTERDWTDADPYTRLHLAHHAGEGRVLDRLLSEAGFLARAEPARLLAALPAARTEPGRRTARLVQRVGQQLLVAPEDERVCYLEMAARMTGDERLAQALAASAPERPWSVLWARWDALAESRMLGHHEDYVLALATVATPRGIVLVSASDWGVQAWYLADGEPMATGIREPASPITDMAAFRQGDGVVIVTLHEDGTLLRTAPDATHAQRVIARGRAAYGGVWSVRHAGGIAVVTVDSDRTIEVTSAEDGHRLASPRVVIGEEDRVLDVDHAGGRCIAVVAGPGGETTAWGLNDATPLGEPLRPAASLAGWGPDMRFWTASLAEREGQPLILLGAQTGHVLAWEPVRGGVVGEPHRGDAGVFVALFTGWNRDAWSWGDWNGDLFTRDAQGEVRQLAAHDGGIQSLAQCELNGSTVIVTGGRDGSVRVWDNPAVGPPAPANSCRSVTSGVDAADRDCVAAVRGDGSLVVLDAATGEVRAELPSEEGCRTAATLPGDPHSFVTLDARRHLTLRRFPDARPARDMPVTEADLGRVMPAQHERPVLLVPTKSGQLHFLDLATGEPVRAPLACHDGGFQVAALPEERRGTLRIITWSWQLPRDVRLWDVTTDEARHRELPRSARGDPDDPLYTSKVAFGRSGDVPVAVAVGSYSRVLVWNTDDGSLVSDVHLERGHGMELLDVGVAHVAGKPLAVTGGHTCSVALWSLETRQEHHLRIGSVLWHTRFLPGQRILAAGPRGIMVLAVGPRLLTKLERP
ncbi:hypothetical protein [Streptomyces sp. PA5.6]|uniref:hypothetical protein n=1 Tax=Streptomyces sp. PA5.6 TaxID=3035651 RepID=UPI00390468DB